MSILAKVRGLWRFDGDVDPALVSRRSFLFMGGVVAAGLALPWPAVEPLFYGGAVGGSMATTAMGLRLERDATQRLFKENYRQVIPAMFMSPDECGQSDDRIRLQYAIEGLRNELMSKGAQW